MSSDFLSDPIRDGLDAQRLLDDPVFRGAVAKVDADLVKEWRVATTKKDREQAWAKQAALDEVIRRIRVIVEGGQVAFTRQ